MYIDKNALRINIYAPFTSDDGVRYPNLLDESIRSALGITEIVDPVPPEDFSLDTHLIKETDTPPYIRYERRPENEILSLMLQKYEQALDDHLDTVAQADRWRDRFTFVARAAYPNLWQHKAIAFGTWMDTCNTLAYTHMQAILEGTEQLIPIQDFIAALPVFTFLEEQV